MIPTYKASITFVKQTKNNMHEQRLAERFSIDDRNQVDIILKRFRKDARGNLSYVKKDALELLTYFQKYIDPDVSNNIFGCGGCAKKIINQMQLIAKQWQNQII
mgnify:CR=1 FL=1|tara:strand:- start:1795 stop:2106 length:312 start_codon:yes stop_codon:yes gene_type:complete